MKIVLYFENEFFKEFEGKDEQACVDSFKAYILPKIASSIQHMSPSPGFTRVNEIHDLIEDATKITDLIAINYDIRIADY